jgi:hypothetical protein
MAKQSLEKLLTAAKLARAKGDRDAAENYMREVEAALKQRFKVERLERPKSDSADDVRAGLRQVQQALKELREQFKKLLDERSSHRD